MEAAHSGAASGVNISIVDIGHEDGAFLTRKTITKINSVSGEPEVENVS